MTDVPVIVVTTNAERHLDAWLSAVVKQGTSSVKPIPCIADNGSSDRTSGIIWDAIRRGVVDRENVFWLRRNEWFNSAQNYAFRVLGSRGYEYIATLNEDALPESGWLSALHAKANAPLKIGMVGGPILTPNRSRISSAGHTLRGSDGAFLDVDWDMDANAPRYSGNTNYEPFAPCFAAALWSVAMIEEVGLPDNEQLIYYDDVELAYKARLRGWSAAFAEEAKAVHPLPRVTKNPIRLRAQQRGRLAIAARYFPDVERQRILDDALAEGAADEHLRLFFGTPWAVDADRIRVWSQWVDRYPQ